MPEQFAGDAPEGPVQSVTDPVWVFKTKATLWDDAEI
jgi:hypothetical protein